MQPHSSLLLAHSALSPSAPMHAFMWFGLIHFQVIALKALIPLSYAHEVVVLSPR